MTQQTIDWAAELGTLRRIHLRQALRERTLVLVSLPIIVLLGFVLPAWRNFFWLGTLVVLLIVLLGTWLQLQRLSQMARAGGKTELQLGPDVLHLQNAFGSFDIPFSQMNKTFDDPEGLVVQYAGAAMFTLPSGPVKNGLLATLRKP